MIARARNSFFASTFEFTSSVWQQYFLESVLFGLHRIRLMKLTLKKVISKIVRLLFVMMFAIATTSGSTLLLPASASAIAAPTPTILAISDSKAKTNLDTVSGAGTSDRLEGKAQKFAGTVQGKVEEVSGIAKQKAAQAQGKVKEDIGRTKGAIEQKLDETDESTSNLIDNVKDFFKG